MSSSINALRTGIVGAGHISEFHLQALLELDFVQIVGIADLDQDLAKRRADEFGIAAHFRSFSDLLDQNLDVVHVLTPPSSHATLTIQALEKGCHVFVEKPLAESVDECDRILAAAKRANRIVSVDHSLLRDPFTVRALGIVQSGKIGEVESMELLRNQDLPPYAGGPLPAHYQKGGYPFRDLGIHALYQIEAFLGAVDDIDFQFRKLGNDPNLQFDHWRATVECQKGSAHIRLSWNARPLQDTMIIQGTHGAITVDRFGMRVLTRRSGRLPEHPQRLVNAMQESLQTAVQVPINLLKVVTKRIKRYHGLKQMVRDFYDCLRRDQPPLVSAQDARRISYWVEQVSNAADQEKKRLRTLVDKNLKPKILVTGGTGLIGTELASRWFDSDEPIRMTVRKLPEEPIVNHPKIDLMIGDLGDPEFVDKALCGIERVLHIAGTTHGEPHEFECGNVAATKNIVDGCLKHRVQQLIYISSLSVLHSSTFRADTPIDESWPLEANAELRGAYTKTKLDAENYVTAAVNQSALPAVIFRPAEVIGRGAPTLSSGVAQQVKGRLIVLGNGKLEVPLINVKDLVDAIMLAHEKKIVDGSIIQIVDSNSMNQNELLKAFQEITGDQSAVHHVPNWFLFPAAFGLQLGLAMLRKRSPLSIYRLKSALSKRTFQSNVAKQLLCWSPQRGIVQALRESHSDLVEKPNSIAESDTQFVKDFDEASVNAAQ